MRITSSKFGTKYPDYFSLPDQRKVGKRNSVSTDGGPSSRESSADGDPFFLIHWAKKNRICKEAAATAQLSSMYY